MALETSKEDLPLAMGLGLVVMAIIIIVNVRTTALLHRKLFLGSNSTSSANIVKRQRKTALPPPDHRVFKSLATLPAPSRVAFAAIFVGSSLCGRAISGEGARGYFLGEALRDKSGTPADLSVVLSLASEVAITLEEMANVANNQESSIVSGNNRSCERSNPEM